jgi:flavin-dependent dehydrogenase
MHFDVLIAGAGPAGCATALMLAEVAPELQVGLASGPPAPTPRIGETAPPELRPVLRQLGVWDAFVADRHSPSYRTLSAWGDGLIASNEFIFHAEQVGWRLDRARFDATLAGAATSRIASFVALRATRLKWTDGEWQVGLANGETCSARFVVDATGRSSALSRSQGVRPESLDRLVGCFMHIESPGDDNDGPLIEAFPDGWWYTTAIPGRRRVIACMTDVSEVRRLGLQETGGLIAIANRTQHVRLFARDARPIGPPRIAPANSRRLPGVVGESAIVAVGDAASSFDPVCGQGIVKALRSGIFASYAIVDWMRRRDGAGVQRYQRLLDDEFSAYARTLRAYYGLERRWADRPFWRRRHHPDASLQSAAARAPYSPSAGFEAAQ